MNLNSDEVKVLQHILSQYRPDSGVGNYDVVEALNLQIAQRKAQIKQLEAIKEKLNGS